MDVNIDIDLRRPVLDIDMDRHRDVHIDYMTLYHVRSRQVVSGHVRSRCVMLRYVQQPGNYQNNIFKTRGCM